MPRPRADGVLSAQILLTLTLTYTLVDAFPTFSSTRVTALQDRPRHEISSS